MGLNGAFLTADLFNLFVFFEVLLIASYGLLLYGAGPVRLRASVHYVVFNLTGSALFLLAVSTLYGLTGTLNMADLAQRIPTVPAESAALLQSAALLLIVVFGVKAAIFPLYFWLTDTYGAATAPVAALFVIMTKVGVYCIARVDHAAVRRGSRGGSVCRGTLAAVAGTRDTGAGRLRGAGRVAPAAAGGLPRAGLGRHAAAGRGARVGRHARGGPVLPRAQHCRGGCAFSAGGLDGRFARPGRRRNGAGAAGLGGRLWNALFPARRGGRRLATVRWFPRQEHAARCQPRGVPGGGCLGRGAAVEPRHRRGARARRFDGVLEGGSAQCDAVSRRAHVAAGAGCAGAAARRSPAASCCGPDRSRAMPRPRHTSCSIARATSLRCSVPSPRRRRGIRAPT